MTIRVACAGAGYFSQFHYDSWARFADVSLVGACDTDLTRAEATGLRPFTDLAQMLKDTHPDLLDIILPPPAHATAIRAALAAGVRWIICQKPFCMGLEEARTIAAETDNAGATLIVHENFRFQPWYRAIKAEIDAGRIGTVLNASFRLRPGDGQGPRAYLDRQPYFQTMPRFLVHETAVHWIDTFQYLFGPARAVYADLRRLNPAIAGEDAGHILLDHGGGLQSHFDGNRLLDHVAENQRKTMGDALVEGTAGAQRLSGDGEVHFRARGAMAEEQVLPPDTALTFGGDCVHALNAHVLRAMAGTGAAENRASDYLSVLEVEAAVYRSAETGRKITL